MKAVILTSIILVCALIASPSFSAQIHVSKSFLSPVMETQRLPGLPWDALNTSIMSLNTKTGNTIVVWTTSNTAGKSVFLGRLLSPKGIAIAKTFVVLGPEINPYKALQSVTYNPIMNEFLLVYAYHKDILVIRLNPNGHPIGKSINLTNEPSSSQIDGRGYAKALFNPKTSGYTILWLLHGAIRVVNDTYYEGIMLTKEGLPNGHLVTTLLQKDRRFVAFDYAILPSGEKIVGVWREGNIADFRGYPFWLGTFNSLLKNINSDPNSFSQINTESLSAMDGIRDIRTASFGSFSNSTEVVFFADDTTIKGRKIDFNGTLSGSPFIAIQPPGGSKKLGFPSVAVAQTAKGIRGLLIGLEDNIDGGTVTWAQVLNETGDPIGSPVVIDSTLSSQLILNGVVTALPPDPSNKIARFVWCATLVEAKWPHITPRQPGSILKLNLDLIP